MTGTSLDAYWLRHCQGFAVDSPRGFVGFVEYVRFGSRLDRPEAIAVRRVPVGLNLLVVEAADVVRVLPAEQRLVLRRAPDALRTRVLRRRGAKDPERPRAA